MISLARFILKGYSQAALVAASTALLGLLLPPLAWLSGAAVALVTLVNGHRSGLLVTAIAGVGTAVLAGLIGSVPEIALYYVLLVWLPLVMIAVVLRQTVSLVLCLQVIAGVSMLGIVLLYLFFPDFGEIWRPSLDRLADELVAQSDGDLDRQNLQGVIDQIVRLLPGFFASSFMIGTMLSLYLARWWQASLYNPGGFGKEFRAINLGKVAALIALAIAAAAPLSGADVFSALLLAVFALYLNQGIAVLHAVFAGKQLNAVWLFLVYLLMFFVPHTVVLLALAGLADTWIDFRGRFSALITFEVITMEIILLETIDRLGGLGDLVNVRPGFARNYLLPQGKAKLATPENIAEIEAHRAELEKHEAEVLAAAKVRAEQLAGLEVTITAKSAAEGKLFGSVTNANITDAIRERGIEVEKSEIRMPEGPIRMAGEYDIDLHLHADVNATIKLTVVGVED